MTTAEVIETPNGQAIRLPEEFRFRTQWVSVRRQGDGVVVEPIKAESWPTGFFDAIRIDDPAFKRPEQGPLPSVPRLD
jgi:virulence-associated protein VagC